MKPQDILVILKLLSNRLSNMTSRQRELSDELGYSFQASKIEEVKSLITTFNKTSDELIQLMKEPRIELNKEQSC